MSDKAAATHKQNLSVPLPPAWSELWRDLAHRDDGTIRALPDATERMIVHLKKLEAAGNADHAAVCRYTLQQFHEDVILLERSAPYRAVPRHDQDVLRTTWFSFRRSAHTWSDLVTTLRAADEPHALIPLVARELWENRDQYRSDLATGYNPQVFTDARRVLRYLNDSFHLIGNDEATIIPEVSSILYKEGFIDEVEYVNRLANYARSAGRTLEDCTYQIAKAGELLPDTIKLEAETELVKLGTIIGTVLKHERISDCMRLLDAPNGVLAGMAPALIQRLSDELHYPEGRTAFDMLTFLVSPSSLLLHRSTLAQVAPAIVSEMIPALEKLAGYQAVTVLDRFSPLINYMEWFNRNSSSLGMAISTDGPVETLPLRTVLLKCVLHSPTMTNDMSTWCSLQLGFRSCAPRLEAVARLLANVVKERRELGPVAVSDAVCLAALRALSCLGPAKRLALVDVGALVGVPILNVWKLGPVVLPYSISKDESPEVVSVATETLLSIASEGKRGVSRRLAQRVSKMTNLSGTRGPAPL